MTAPDQLAETLVKALACGSHPHTTLREWEMSRFSQPSLAKLGSSQTDKKDVVQSGIHAAAEH